MLITKVTATPMSAHVPKDKQHRTDLGTKVKSDATLIRVETDSGLVGIGAALGSPPVVKAMGAIAGVDIAVWDVKAQALGIPLYQAQGAVRSSVRGYASGGWAPGDE